MLFKENEENGRPTVVTWAQISYF